nr:unnamed protein product [Callosobruchus chinensis]
MPSSKEEWKRVAEGFNSRWQIPNCGGAIDGKHIRIFQPANTGAMYYNYKNFYSIVLMAIMQSMSFCMLMLEKTDDYRMVAYWNKQRFSDI